MKTSGGNIESTLRALHAARNDPSEAGRVVEGLTAIGDEVVASLVTALGNADFEVRSGAAFALGYIPFFSEGKYDITAAIPVLVASTGNRDPWVAFHATKSLWTICKENEGYALDEEQIVGKITAFLESSDPLVRAAAAKQLGLTRRWDEVVIPRLIDRLDDPVLEVRCATASTLCGLGGPASDALSKFMAWVNSEIPEESFIASLAITRIDEAYREALVPCVLESFGRLGSAFRVSAAYLLGEILENDHRVFPLLVGCYKQNSDRELRLAAVNVIAGYGLHIKETMPILTEAIHDEDREVACAAVCGVKAVCVVNGLGPEAAAVAVPHLIEVLDAELARGDTGSSRDGDLRLHFLWEVCATLGYIGQAAQAAMPCLRRAGRNGYTEIRRAAREALKRIRDSVVWKFAIAWIEDCIADGLAPISEPVTEITTGEQVVRRTIIAIGLLGTVVFGASIAFSQRGGEERGRGVLGVLSKGQAVTVKDVSGR